MTVEEHNAKLLKVTQKAYLMLTEQAAELAECCETLLDCFQQREDGRWELIPDLNYGVAITEARSALAAHNTRTSLDFNEE